jgi:hypothetical protein
MLCCLNIHIDTPDIPMTNLPISSQHRALGGWVAGGGEIPDKQPFFCWLNIAFWLYSKLEVLKYKRIGGRFSIARIQPSFFNRHLSIYMVKLFNLKYRRSF